MPKQTKKNWTFDPIQIRFLMNFNYRSMWVHIHEIVDHVLQPYKL